MMEKEHPSVHPSVCCAAEVWTAPPILCSSRVCSLGLSPEKAPFNLLNVFVSVNLIHEYCTFYKAGIHMANLKLQRVLSPLPPEY